MLKKIENRNYKKIWKIYAAAAVIAAVAAVAAFFLIIGTNAAVMHHHEWIETLPLAGKITIGSIAGAAGIMGIIYWILVVESMIKQTLKDGANTVLFGILTLFFNVGAVIGYFIYRSFKLRCPVCGKIAAADNQYCAYCGTKLEQKCGNCGERVLVTDKFCKNCGHEI